MSGLRWLYLGIALWGAVHPLYWFGTWFATAGTSPAALLAAWQVNAATTGLAWDLVIAAVALIVWILAEVSVRRNWSALIALPVTVVIGVGCGLPLYLFLRTRPV